MDILITDQKSVSQLPDDWVLLESGISGGTYEDYLAWAVSEFAECLAIYLLPVRHRFRLPCYDGQGEYLDEAHLAALRADHPSAFTSLLCCNWCFIPTAEMLLWDDRASLMQRLRMAEAAGVPRVVINAEIQKKFRLPETGSPISVI